MEPHDSGTVYNSNTFNNSLAYARRALDTPKKHFSSQRVRNAPA